MKCGFFICFLFLALNVHAKGNRDSGEKKSDVCVSCHGNNGLSTNPSWPNIAGQKVQYLINQLKAFRSEERSDSLMGPISQTLSDQDIEDLAAYYSSLPKG